MEIAQTPQSGWLDALRAHARSHMPAALGLGLAETVPGRSPLIDGFGLIAFASLFPIIAVMGYAQLTELREHHWPSRRTIEKNGETDDNSVN